MSTEVDELREAGDILLALRRAPQNISKHLPRCADRLDQSDPSSSPQSIHHQHTPPMGPWLHPSQLSPRSLDGRLTPPYGYPPFIPLLENPRVQKRPFRENEPKFYPTCPTYLQPPMQPMTALPTPMVPHYFPFAMSNAPRSPISEPDTGLCTNTLIHRVLCKQLANALAEKLGYGTIQPFRPADSEYRIVFEGVRTMFYSKNKKAAWRTTYRNFLDYIGVKTRKFPPSWWCVSNKDITPEQREKCMRLLLTIGVETLALLDEFRHAPFPFHEEVDAGKLQTMGLTIRDDISYWQFWEKDWKELAPEVRFESAASMWYLATFNRSLSFLGDGVLKFMTFLIVRRCDFFRVHTGKHAQGKVAKRYIMSSNSMSNSYARLMSIQLLDHIDRGKIVHQQPPACSQTTPQQSQDRQPELKRPRTDEHS